MEIECDVMRAHFKSSARRLLLLLILVNALLQVPYWYQSATVNAAEGLPFTFFLTHYEMLGDPNNPEGVRYHSDGQPFAKAPDGSSVALSGRGAWEPAGKQAEGGGQYTIKDSGGVVKARGAWQVTGFISFVQLPGWWPPGFKEEGWQGSSGSPSFAGNLTIAVNLENQGDGVLAAWCLMPTTPMPLDHISDGISLTGSSFKFTNFTETELSFEGVMFYGPGTDPSDGAWGWSWYIPVAIAAGFVLGMASIRALRRRSEQAPVRVD